MSKRDETIKAMARLVSHLEQEAGRLNSREGFAYAAWQSVREHMGVYSWTTAEECEAALRKVLD